MQRDEEAQGERCDPDALTCLVVDGENKQTNLMTTDESQQASDSQFSTSDPIQKCFRMSSLIFLLIHSGCERSHSLPSMVANSHQQMHHNE